MLSDFFKEKERLFFLSLAAVLFVSMIFVAFRAGTGGDDILDGNNGWYALKYYCHGDTTFVDYSKVPEVGAPHLKYYGVGFEILPAIVYKIFDVGPNEFLVRRLMIAFFGFFLMIFCALIAKYLGNWKLASVTLAVVALTPIVFGLSFYGSKDVPLALGFAVGIFGFLKVYRHLPILKFGDFFWVFVGIALAVSIRIGGLLLAFYFALGLFVSFVVRKDLRKLVSGKKYKSILKIVALCAGVALAGCLIGLLSGCSPSLKGLLPEDRGGEKSGEVYAALIFMM